MRTNLPVSQVETLLPEGEFIYSRTDARGVIVELNDAFARISAFSREEMLGQPHNLVRHPDMPPEAFQDMWRDLKEGLPWRGVVKNRRKDGGYYWVIANVAPVREDGRIIGYQSVRGRPEEAEILAAEAAYRRIRAGDASLRVEHGRVTSTRRFRGLQNLGLQNNVAGSLLALSGLFLAFSAFLPALPGQILGGLGLLYGLYFLLGFAPRLRRDLARVSRYLFLLLKTGDLRSRLEGERPDALGEIMYRLNHLTAWMQSTLQGMNETSRDVRQSAEAVAESVVVLKDSAQVQSDATASVAAGIEEITVSIGEVAANAAATRDAAHMASQASVGGGELARQASETILALADSVRSAASQVERMGAHSREISRITGVIREIADQTNLLALNAAIEAARAGEQGRGFAVVADEVRKLAERSAQATQEISVMVSSAQSETGKAVEVMRASAGQVENGVHLVQSAHDALLEINAQMSRTLAMVSDISHSSGEQQEAMTAMANNIGQVAAMTDQNLTLAGETTRTAETLRAATGRMQMAVEQYTV
ncbi:MAG: methyl-accepting chemotaxis protein [Zoogloeaceae bacterium]|jgi:aerotaxis receptor|nr:methyl-accepting chemotaxis protein [Zoogloeaceae bacterium]